MCGWNSHGVFSEKRLGRQWKRCKHRGGSVEVTLDPNDSIAVVCSPKTRVEKGHQADRPGTGPQKVPPTVGGVTHIYALVTISVHTVVSE